ncbi:aminoglycoside 6'-N-acetyltransferase [Floricoccus penangensis]|uniref:aminoglycoside 6'-N-acetyltransferase n=1 Tax=Floricoccus penangensis TaxID=1859475 RepID=UPI00203F320B|nr:aminoglycoside 6'-N-acetyltransferase [Floricoccus penangensis]URZ87928.1 GNAT family N-acetyltransferase [Floricoccus penangensis]
MIKKANIENLEIVSSLAKSLWPDNNLDDLREEFTGILNDKEAAIFLQEDNGEFIGFAQCQLRHDYVEGCDSSPVGYLEGIYIKENRRRQGFAHDLLKACQKWACESDCLEFASDCELDNLDSLAFHLKMGFMEVNRIICFKKEL